VYSDWTIEKDGLTAPSIHNFVQWRRDSALKQIKDIRKTFTKTCGVDFSKVKLTSERKPGEKVDWSAWNPA
jgi:hypothetical protein